MKYRVLLPLILAAAALNAQETKRDTSTNRPPVGVRGKLGADSLPLRLPPVLSIAERESYRRAAEQIAAARALAFQQNMRTLLQAAWGQMASSTLAAKQPAPRYPGDTPERPAKPPTRTEQFLSEYADVGVQLNGRLEVKAERNQSARCKGLFFDPSLNCRSSFAPLFDFQYNLRSGGVVADRVHLNVDYDSQREFDASNQISLYYEGRGSETLQRLEIGNVTFQPPTSRFITAGIPSGNYGLQAVTKLGSMRLKTIMAQQKGNVIRDRMFTMGDRALQAMDRKIEDFRFEPRRFFFTIDPRRLGDYPNIDILDRQQMLRLSATLPDTLRPTRIFLYRLLIGGQPPNPTGPQFRLLGDPLSRRGQVYELLREGVDYYVDPSQLWIALVRPLSLNNERLVVAYRVRINGRDTVHVTTGGTPDLEYTPHRDQFANLLWDPQVTPKDSAFVREIRSVYRLGGNDIRRSSVVVKIVTGGSADQEKPLTGQADTYLQLFGLAQRTNSSSFDVENRLWPRPSDPEFEISAAGLGARIIRDQFLIFPSLRPFAANGLAGNGNPTNDTVYTTPGEYLNTAQRPQAVYQIRVQYQAEGSGEGGTLMLGAVQLRQNSERIYVDGVPLQRGTDYVVDYDLGRVSFTRPDTLFPRPRQVTVHYEENPLFAETPTSIVGATAEFPLANGQLNFTAISQHQRTTYTRPTLGFEPAAALVGGVNATMSFDADPLTRWVSKLPFGETNAPSHVTLSGEFAASRPQQRGTLQAYIETFEGDGGLYVPLTDPQWYYSSQPAVGRGLPGALGVDVLDLARATTLAWQSNGVDANGTSVRYTIEQIDPKATLVGTGVAVPEQLLWMTLYPLSVGGLRNQTTGRFQWSVTNPRVGRRWRSIRTPLGPTGSDLTRVEHIEFWALIDTSSLRRSKNPTLVMDFGDISENSVVFAPETLVVRRDPAVTTRLDSLFSGRRLIGYDQLNSERDPFSRAFNADVNDVGLPGDLLDTLVFFSDTLPRSPGQPIGPPVKLQGFPTCTRGSRVIQTLGDARSNCTRQNFRLDEEDVDADNVLNLTAAERDSERWRRYVIDLSDNRLYNRVGKCVRPPDAGDAPRGAPSDSVCWVFVRVPFRAPYDSLGDPLLRRTRAMRVTMISGAGLDDNEFSRVALARLRLSGAPWLKRSDRPLVGVADEHEGVGTVTAGSIGTQDKNTQGGVDYEPPPGVSDAPLTRTTPLGPERVQINERSLRLTAQNLDLFHRAEAYYRFPEGEKNFMGYRQLRLWARGIRSGWGADGELQFFVKVGRDANNFYLYRTPLDGGNGRTAWLPEVRLDFNRFFTLRSQVQNAYLRNTRRNTCTGLDSVIIASTPLPAGYTPDQRYAACADGYIVYTLDPGVTPPNLAAVQELAVGMIRTSIGTGPVPVSPTDTLELWVDDVRLAGVVDATGFAGQLGVSVVASDFADVRVNVSRRDPHFRQLAEQPSYLSDNAVDISSAFHLEKLFARTFGYSIPVTFNYTSVANDPLFMSESDIEGDAIEGLRAPKSTAASVTVSVRRSVPLKDSPLAPLVNNLALTTTYTAARAQTEYQTGEAHNLVVGLDYNLSNALFPGLARLAATDLHLTSTYVRGRDERFSYLKPAVVDGDVPHVVGGLTNTWRNGSSLQLRPSRSSMIRWDIVSVRDFRTYGTSSLGLVTNTERDRILGLNAGIERAREMQSAVSYAPEGLGWFKPRVSWSGSYNMLRDPNAPGFVRGVVTTPDPGSGTPGLATAYKLPRRLGNAQTTTIGALLDVAQLADQRLDSASFLHRVVRSFQPIDIQLNRNLISVYDGTPASASLAYQFGWGGPASFRNVRGDLATSAGVVSQFVINHGVQLPFGFTLGNRYQRIQTRSWTKLLERQHAVTDGTQVVSPDLTLGWSRRPRLFADVVSSVNLTARMLETRQVTGTPLDLDALTIPEPSLTGLPFIEDRGAANTRSYPVSASIVWAGERPVTTRLGVTSVRRSDVRPGLDSRGSTMDVDAEVTKPFKLPDNWKPRSDLRTRLSYQNSQGNGFVLNPAALDRRSRLSDAGREAYSLSADTDVAENLSSSFAVSRITSFDRNLSRRFTQTVLSAVLHLQFYAGDLK